MRSTFFLTYFAFLLGACGSASANHHEHRRHHARATAAIVAAAAKQNNPTSGTPISDFSAGAGLPVAGLAAAAKKAKKAGQKYPISHGSKISSTIYTDWAGFKSVSFSFFFWWLDYPVVNACMFDFAGCSLRVHG